MSVKVSARFVTKRIASNLRMAGDVLNRDLRHEVEAIAQDEADRWSSKVARAGRGGSLHAQMRNIETQVTVPKSGAVFIRMGWLSSPPIAKDGKTSWFVYWDTGFQLFGRPGEANAMPGIKAQMDARINLNRRVNNLVYDIARKVERTATRG